MEWIPKHNLKVGHIDTTIWQEKGRVKQSGHFNLPENLAEFENTKEGREQAGAFISGMLYLAKLLKQ